MPQDEEPYRVWITERTDKNTLRFSRRAFAVCAAVVMILVGFSVVGQRGRAEGPEAASTEDAAELGVTTYGPGIAVTPLPDRKVRVQHLPTFQRWDGEWRPMSALNLSTGEWPYVLEETSTEIRATRFGKTVAQAKLPSASYEFMLDGIKETIALNLFPTEGVVSIRLSTADTVAVRGDSIDLQDASGSIVWRSDGFHAWDSAESPRTWDRPVSSVTYSEDVLRLTLNSAMLSTATFPLYLDPTWKTNASLGWPSTSKTDVTQDLGDRNLRIGWFADNFNDNVGDSNWTVDQGSWSESSGSGHLGLNTRVRTTSSTWDTSVQAKITVTVSGGGSQIAKVLVRWTNAQNHYFVEIKDAQDTVALKKVVSGMTTTLCSGSTSIGVGTPYVVKAETRGSTFSLTWAGSVLCSGTDPSPPAPNPTATVGFETSGNKVKIDVDDVRAWATDLGFVTTSTRNQVPCSVRTIHSGAAFNWVDLRILSSADNVVWGDPHYVKSGATSQPADIDAYYIQNADRKSFYRARIDLRTTDDLSPSLSEIAVVEGACSSVSTGLLGFEPWRYYIGGIIEAMDGNLVLQTTDLSLPGKGWPLAFTRTYNSRGVYSGPLGGQWTHSYNALLTFSAGEITFRDGDGTTHVYEELGNLLYASPRGMSGTKLVNDPEGTYTLSWKDGSRSVFDPAGKLVQLKERNGNKVTLTYDGHGRLSQIADDSGISPGLSYDANGRISRVRDHNVTTTWKNFTANGGSWANPSNAVSSNNQYATSSSASATHDFYNYGFAGPPNAWITKVEACIEAHTAGDDDLGVRITTNGGGTWSAEHIVNLPAADPNSLTCLDFTSHLPSWTWNDLGNGAFRAQVRYVKIGQASADSLDWIPVRVSTATRSWSYFYDASGLLASATDPMGNSTLYTYYPASSRMKVLVDRADKVLEFFYNFINRVSEVWTGKYNRTTSTIEWKFREYAIDTTSQNQRTLVTDALGNVTTIDRAAQDAHPIRIDGPLAATGIGCSCCGTGSELWTIEWDGEFNWFSRTDGKNQKTMVTYDWRGNRAHETDALGNYTEATWQNRDNGTVFDSLMLKQRNKRAFVTTNDYDWKGNPIKTTDALGNFTRTFYTSAGFVNKTTDKRGVNTTYTYDAHGWRLDTTDPLRHTTKSEYDAVGRLVKTTTALNFVSRRAYNANDWGVSDSNPLNFVTAYEYNGRGDRTAVIDANGNRTTTVVNITWAKAHKIIEATGDTTENTYDKLGRLVQVKDPRGKLWKYDLDKFGRQMNVTDPLNQKTRFSYDAAGNVVQRIDGNGKFTNYTLYDTLNRIKTVSYQDANTLTYSYDANSNLVSETGYGFTRTTEYDALDRVKKVTFNFGSFSKIVQYSYDQNGNRKTMVYPDGFTVTYIWDADNRLSNIQITGQTWTFIYDNDHRRTAARHPNGLELNATYDSATRITDLRSKNLANGSTVESFTYTHDNLVNRRTLTHMNGTQLSFAYTTDYALNATTYETGAKAYYFYDANDNRRFRNETGAKRTEYGYGLDSSLSHRELLSGGTVQVTNDYTYDANGNRLRDSRTVTGQGTTIFDYVYDLENRLVRTLVNLSEVASFAYSSDGSRIRRTEAGTPTYFLYDFRDFNGYNDIVEEYDSVGNRVARYVHGPGLDEPLAMERGAWYYYHIDGLGSVTVLTRADKTVANRYVYDDFGGFRSKTEAVANSYTFTGREHDDITGMHFYRARYYDHVVGRFLTRDPAGMVDGPNLYGYVRNNPTTLVDPMGRWIYMSWCTIWTMWEGYSLITSQYWRNDKFTHCWTAGALVRRGCLDPRSAFLLVSSKEAWDQLEVILGRSTDAWDWTDLAANWYGAYICGPAGHFEFGWFYIRWVPHPSVEDCCEAAFGNRYLPYRGY